MRRTAAALLVALVAAPSPAALRTTVTRLHSEEGVRRSGAPALAVQVIAADPGLAAALDRALADALDRHSHAVRVGPGEAADWTLALRPEPPVRREGSTVLAFRADLHGADGRQVWAVAGTVEDDGVPGPDTAVASLARNLVDRLTQDGWAHPRRDPANPAPPPPRLALGGTAGDPR